MKKRNWMIGILCLLLGCCIGCASAESVDAAAIEALLDEWEKAYPTEVLLAEMEALHLDGPGRMPTDSDIPLREALRRSATLILTLQWETLDSLTLFRPAVHIDISPDFREWFVGLDEFLIGGTDAYYVSLNALTGTPTRIRRGMN